MIGSTFLGIGKLFLGVTFHSFYKFPKVLIWGQAFNIRGTFEGDTPDPNGRPSDDSIF